MLSLLAVTIDQSLGSWKCGVLVECVKLFDACGKIRALSRPPALPRADLAPWPWCMGGVVVNRAGLLVVLTGRGVSVWVRKLSGRNGWGWAWVGGGGMGVRMWCGGMRVPGPGLGAVAGKRIPPRMRCGLGLVPVVWCAYVNAEGTLVDCNWQVFCTWVSGCNKQTVSVALPPADARGSRN